MRVVTVSTLSFRLFNLIPWIGVSGAGILASGALVGSTLGQSPTPDLRNVPSYVAANTDADSEKDKQMNERAVLAGGCFWGMEELIRRLPGVVDTRVGYTGGKIPNATYRRHGGHAEAIEIEFDPDQLSYRDLLEFFFQIHDPTTRNRQGNDRGPSYRSAIYYTTDAQKETALDTIQDVNASRRWPGKVVTEVEPAGPFWEAEPEHQDYLQRFPNGYTCHFPRPQWILPPGQEKEGEKNGQKTAN